MRQLVLGSLAGVLSLSMTVNAGERDWYVGIEGGAELTGTHDGGTMPGSEIGLAVFGTIGHKFGDGRISLEGELGYRSTDDKEFFVEIAQLSAIVNLLYEAPLADGFSLFFGGGAGVDYVEIELPWGSGDDLQGAVQFKGGLNFSIAAATDLSVSYRYMTTFSNGIADLDNSTVTVGLRFAL